MAITPLDTLPLTPQQRNLYNSQFVNGETPLDADSMNLLLSLVKLNYDNAVLLNDRVKSDEAVINSVTATLDSITNEGILIFGGGVDKLPQANEV